MRQPQARTSSRARLATLLCPRDLVSAADSPLSRGVEGDVRRAAMAHLVDKEFLERANSVLLLGILWGGFAICVIAATLFDIALWFRG